MIECFFVPSLSVQFSIFATQNTNHKSQLSMNFLFPFVLRPELDAQNPNNDEDPRERVFTGCFSTILTILIAFILLVLIDILCSCSSHKAITHVIDESHDSIKTTIIDSLQNTLVYSDQSVTTTLDSVHHNNVSEGESSSTEMITENITETVDSIGNRVINTYRVIQRNNNYSYQYSTDFWSKSQNEQYNNELSLMDSIVVHKNDLDEIHYSYGDSTNIDRQTISSSPLSFWQRIKAWLTRALVILTLLTSLYVIFKHKKSQTPL